MASYYTYIHRPGYGRDDHMADELIARAIRRLGGDTGKAIAAHAGFTSHPVPMGGVNVRLPVARGVKRRMIGALRAARRELARSPDCSIYVACVRSVHVRSGETCGGSSWSRAMTLEQERRGREWVTVESREAPRG